MAVAVIQTHWPNGFFWTDKGFEYPLMWGIYVLNLFAVPALALTGHCPTYDARLRGEHSQPETRRIAARTTRIIRGDTQRRPIAVPTAAPTKLPIA